MSSPVRSFRLCMTDNPRKRTPMLGLEGVPFLWRTVGSSSLLFTPVLLCEVGSLPHQPLKPMLSRHVDSLKVRQPSHKNIGITTHLQRKCKSTPGSAFPWES